MKLSEGYVYSKMHGFISYSIAAAICLAGLNAARAQTAAPDPAPNQAPALVAASAILRGHIADPTGALIPGASVSVATAEGTAVKTVAADAAGVYTASGLAPGPGSDPVS